VPAKKINSFCTLFVNNQKICHSQNKVAIGFIVRAKLSSKNITLYISVFTKIYGMDGCLGVLLDLQVETEVVDDEEQHVVTAGAIVTVTLVLTRK